MSNKTHKIGDFMNKEKLSFEERAVLLVANMTLEEKISQIGNAAPAIERLGIREYNWWKEAVHGVRDSAATSFPHGLGIAASWNRKLVKDLATVIADEGRVNFLEGTGAIGVNYWCPTFNMLKDPRWGRAEESYGEDPYLAGETATAFIQGMQGQDDGIEYTKTMATSKHFLGNSSDSNRCTGSSNISEKDLYEYYLPAFKKSVEEGNVRAIMTSYNCVNDVPMSVNKELLTDLVRERWGFDGFFVTDCDTLIHIKENYAWRPDDFDYSTEWEYKKIVSLAIEAGVDLNCGRNYQESMLDAINEGSVSVETLNNTVIRLFTERFRSGEFDGELCNYNTSEYKRECSAKLNQHQLLAERASDEAVVLLKNGYKKEEKRRILPLDGNIENLVVIGNLSDKVILGDYSTTQPIHTSTPLQGITKYASQVNPKMNIQYISAYSNDSLELLTASNLKVYNRDNELIYVFPLWQAEPYNTDYFKYINGGLEILCNATDGSYIKFPEEIDLTYADHFSIGAGGDYNPTLFQLRQGNPVNGTLLGEIAVDEQTPNNWTYKEHFFDFSGKEGGYNKPLKDIYLTFKANYSMEPYVFSTEERRIISDADAVVIYVGTLPGQNGYRESSDGKNVDLVNFQNDMIQNAVGLNSNCIVYMQAVTQVNIESFKDKVAALIWCTYNGQAQGNAVGRILFGQTNPSAKLPFTWYTDIGQLADIKDYTIRSGGKQYLNPLSDNKGRTYQFFTGAVTYPFGYGLSYSEFEYSNLQINKEIFSPGDSITISYVVTNNSTIDGQTVAQVYVVNPVHDQVEGPAKQLKGYDKIFLRAGETKKCSMKISVEDLSVWSCDEERYTCNSGLYSIQVGEDSQSCEMLQASFMVEGELKKKLKHLILNPTGHYLYRSNREYSISCNAVAVYNDMSKEDGKSLDIIYTSSDNTVATVNQEGIVSCPSNSEGGIVTISAQIMYENKTVIAKFAIYVM